MPHTAPRHRYKEIRLQQLRSFCETARLGSLTAAAEALGLAQPTVWEQVHALEKLFGRKLVERESHGCRLTESGQLLVDLAAPRVNSMDSLLRDFQEREGNQEVWLTLAATERSLVEDLPPVITEFERLHPNIRLRILEMTVDNIAAVVEANQADVGLVPEIKINDAHPRLHFEPAYELDLMLVTPEDHPLANRRVIRPQDLLDYPMISTFRSVPDSAIEAALEKLGVFKRPRRIEATYASVIRQFVRMGFGIGVVAALTSRPPDPGLHERSVSKLFGRITMTIVRRKTATTQPDAIQLFTKVLMAILKRRPAKPKRSRR